MEPLYYEILGFFWNIFLYLQSHKNFMQIHDVSKVLLHIWSTQNKDVDKSFLNLKVFFSIVKLPPNVFKIIVSTIILHKKGHMCSTS